MLVTEAGIDFILTDSHSVAQAGLDLMVILLPQLLSSNVNSHVWPGIGPLGRTPK